MTKGSAFRALIAIMLLVSVGLVGCGRRGSLERPPAPYPETKADPSTEMQKAPKRSLWIDKLIE